MDLPDNIWKVIGGAEKGGILVRSGKDLASPQCSDRLATGSLVVATEHDEKVGRLCFELLAGLGPAAGWLSTHVQGKPILVKTGEYDATEDDAEALRWYSAQLERSRCATLPEQNVSDSRQPQPESAEPADIVRPGVERSRVRMTSATGASTGHRGRASGIRSFVPRRHQQALPNRLVVSSKLSAKQDSAALLARDAEMSTRHGLDTLTSCHNSSADDNLALQALPADSDDCRVSEHETEQEAANALCPHCGLPVGDQGYAGESQELVHAECKAQLFLLDLQKEARAVHQKEVQLKQERRAKYGIGWTAERIPRNAVLASSLRCGAAPKGLFCLVLDADSRAVRIVPTIDPRSSINLEYLVLALHVRSSEGREPLFSLDPQKDFTSPSDGKSTMQVKRFEPAWLGGTSAGEVMFQADYYLKELSMGEHSQPVVGLKNCFDLSAGDDDEWRAREWFVIRAADVLLSEGAVLTPMVKMGVEAREQVAGPGGFEDARLTRPDHPLVKYAEAFEHYFDLIAERRSAIYHLREMAKATVMAKFLVEEEILLDNAWFSASDMVDFSADSVLEIPQMWNERSYSHVHVKDGAIVAAEDGVGTRMHGVYGGIEFGLEGVSEFGASRVTAGTGIGNTIQAHVLAKMKAATAVDLNIDTMTRFGAARVTALTAAGMALQPQALPSGKSLRATPVVPQGAITTARSVETPIGARPFRAAPRRGPAPRRAAKGVDLNLDNFNLPVPTEVTLSGGAGSWAGQFFEPETHVVLSRAFWSSLSSETASVFSDEDRALLRALFNPNLSDRRKEGDLFIPPDTSLEHVHKLHELMEEEEDARKCRKEHFLSKDFVADKPGPLFPSSWASTFGVQRKDSMENLPQRLPKWKRVLSSEETARLKLVLKSAVPVFDKSAEDGVHFRIYEAGGLEVRTMQEVSGEEVIGAVFSSRAAAQVSASGSVKDSDRVVKVTEYVEREAEADSAQQPFHYYAVIESDAGDQVVTEKCVGGRVAWVANPRGLEARNALAKVTGCVDCQTAGVLLRDLKAFQVSESRHSRPGASAAERRGYAQSVFCLAMRGQSA